MKKGSFYEAVATLTGTTIGAGIFGIPYVVARAGILAGIINLLVLGVAILLINLYLGEICLRTKKTHQLAGLAELYLGGKGKTIMAFASFFSITGALIAYLIGEGELISAIFGGNPLIFSLFFFVFASTLIYFDLSAIKQAGLCLGIFTMIVALVIVLVSFFNLDLNNLTDFRITNIFLPYGTILFSLIGSSAIPEVEVELRKNKKQIKKAIILGTLIPFAVYFLFMLAVIGVTGINTTEIASIGLGNALGDGMILLGNLFPIFTMATAFLMLGLALKWMFRYDYHLSKFNSWVLTCLPPLVLFLIGINSFIGVIGMTGAIAGGLEGIMILMMVKKAKKQKTRPAYSLQLPLVLEVALMLLFSAGIACQFFIF